MSHSERTSPTHPTLSYDPQSTFNLTSIINSQIQTPRSLSRTLIDFITQKITPSQQSPLSIQPQQSPHQQFGTYLSEISGWIQQIKLKVSKKYNQDIQYMGAEGITRCYTQIPYVFFQKDFVLKMDSYGLKDEMRDEQEELNQYLDLIEINLFSQVNSKFNNFYEALTNFEDLEHRVEDNINRLVIVRRGIPVIKRQFTEKAEKIMGILKVRANKEAVLRHLTIMRSIKKLPPTIKSILESPLPHESLELLSTGKAMYSIIKGIRCMKEIGESLDKSDNVIKHSLYKSFSDKFFLYITSPLSAPFGKNFEEISISSQSNKMDNSYVLQLYEPPAYKQPQLPQTIPKTQEQLVITILQSCSFVDFVSGSRIKSKVLQHSKLISKQFFESLKSYLNNSIDKSKRFQNLSDLLDKVSMQNYSKILQIYHKNYKLSILRLSNTIQHLLVKLEEYQDNQKYVDILQQLFYLLSGIVKIVCDETAQLVSLKKLSREISNQEFQVFLKPLNRWIEYLKSVLNSPIFVQKEGQRAFEVHEYKNKINILLEPLIETKGKLEDAYITNFHMSVISSQIKSQLQQDPWTAVDISYQYLPLFNYIFNKNHQGINASYNTSFNNSFTEEITRTERVDINDHLIHPRDVIDIKLCKNGIILDRKIYKTTISFLNFCQIFHKYLKIQESFPGKHHEMISRLGDISTYYSSYSIQLIVFAGALKFNVIKSKNITVKHLCLLWCNLRILLTMLQAQKYPQLQKTIDQIQTHSNDVIRKMSTIISTKVQSQLSTLIKQGLGVSAPTQPITNIINSQKQMIEITQQYLDEGSIRDVMAQSVNLMIKKFLEYVEGKGERGNLEGKYYVESMKELEIGFQNEMEYMKKVLKL